MARATKEQLAYRAKALKSVPLFVTTQQGAALKVLLADKIAERYRAIASAVECDTIAEAQGMLMELRLWEGIVASIDDFLREGIVR